MYKVCVVLAAFVLAVAGQSCYWNNKCSSTNHFGSKSMYDDVRGDVRDSPDLVGCSATGVWTAVRHGTRYPTVNNGARMKEAANFLFRYIFQGESKICAQDLTNLLRWVWNENMEFTPAYLTHEGSEELYQLGFRFHQKFDNLLSKLSRYQFKPTTEQRTQESAAAYARGLSLGLYNFKVEEGTNDEITRPYYNCNRFDADPILEEYYQTDEFQKMLVDVSNRIGLDHVMSPSNATAVYDLCRFYRAISMGPKISPWCAFLTEEDLEVLEYTNDLSNYYKNGYGSSVNTKLGSPALKNLFLEFENIVSGAETASYIAYFSHDSFMQMLYSALGLFKDASDLSPTERDPSRQWRTSYVVPFAANFAAVLYQCPAESPEASYKVQFFINEVETRICADRTCSWDEFKDIFEPYSSTIDDCNAN